MEKIAIYVLSFVLPLAATLILFGIVKSSGQVDGTVPSGFLKGLKINFGGAFAGFFVLTVFVFEFVTPHWITTYQVWHVHGRAQFAGGQAPASVKGILRPPHIDIDENQRFDFDVNLPDDTAMSLVSFEPDGYENETVLLLGETKGGPQTVQPKIDKVNHLIDFEATPIVFHKKDAVAPYDPHQTGAQQAAQLGGPS